MDEAGADALYQRAISSATAAYAWMEKGKKEEYEQGLTKAITEAKSAIDKLLPSTPQPLMATICKFAATTAYQLGLMEEAKVFAIQGIAGEGVPTPIGRELRHMLRSLTREPWPDPEMSLEDEPKTPKKRTKKPKAKSATDDQLK